MEYDWGEKEGRKGNHVHFDCTWAMRTTTPVKAQKVAQSRSSPVHVVVGDGLVWGWRREGESTYHVVSRAYVQTTYSHHAATTTCVDGHAHQPRSRHHAPTTCMQKKANTVIIITVGRTCRPVERRREAHAVITMQTPHMVHVQRHTVTIQYICKHGH